MIAFVVMLRRRGLYCADRIRRRKTVDQAGFEPGVNLAIRLGGLARIGGMPVMRRGIKLLSHEILRCGVNGRVLGKFRRFAGRLAAGRNKSTVASQELPPGGSLILLMTSCSISPSIAAFSKMQAMSI
jgi:hypothetical protein